MEIILCTINVGHCATALYISSRDGSTEQHQSGRSNFFNKIVPLGPISMELYIPKHSDCEQTYGIS